MKNSICLVSLGVPPLVLACGSDGASDSNGGSSGGSDSSGAGSPANVAGAPGAADSSAGGDGSLTGAGATSVAGASSENGGSDGSGAGNGAGGGSAGSGGAGGSAAGASQGGAMGSAGGSALDPKQPPGHNFDLSRFTLQLPILDSKGNLAQIPAAQLYALGSLVSYSFKLDKSMLTIVITDAKGSTTFTTPYTASSWTKDSYYFKLGDYVQDNTGGTTDGGRVAFYSFSIKHG